MGIARQVEMGRALLDARQQQVLDGSEADQAPLRDVNLGSLRNVLK